MTAKPLFVIGLTGSVGMGKSTTAAMFAAEGLSVWDADAAVHRLYARGGAAVAVIRDICPKAISNGAVDRAVLKAWIDRDAGALAKIETVVHPLVARDRQRFLRNAASGIVVLDIPLLFETGGDAEADAIVVVTVAEEEQRRRVLTRGMSKAQFLSILSRQMPDAEKRARADFVIETTTMDAARQSVRRCIRDIRKKLTHA